MNTEPKKFEFSADNLKMAKKYIAKYPEGRQASAVKSLLYLAQYQEGWVSQDAMDYVANMLSMPAMRVYEVANFYTMFHLKPVGKHVINICRTTPCWLRGSDDITHTCKSKLGIDIGETSQDGMFTIKEAECVGACVNAPVVIIDDEYYEDLDATSMGKIIDDLKSGKEPRKGSQKGRMTSAPEGGLTTLNKKKKVA